MELFEWTLALLLGSVALTAISRRINAPYPVLLALAGAAIALVPNGPEIRIEPDLALALFIAPILLDSAFDTSPRDLRRNVLPLTSLVVVAVLVTVASVALFAHHWAGMPLAAAIALGAIVAPPDASAAAAILSDIRLPRRVRQLLDGESLLNDATAIMVYRLAVAAAVGHITWSHAGPMLALSAVGSPVAGYILARLYDRATARIEDPASFTVLTFVGTFGVWILAERLGLSAIITTVVYGMTLSHSSSSRTSARNRVSSYSVWETAVFTLNVLAFVLMGLQARPILARLAGDGLAEALAFSGAVLAIVIVTRVAYVMTYASVLRLKHRLLGGPLAASVGPAKTRSALLVSWSGMRGLVTLATAFALPADFPFRDQIVLAAFVVVLGTLVIQGLTLKLLVTRLGLQPDTEVEHEVSHGRQALITAAVAALEGDSSVEADRLRAILTEERQVAQDQEAPQRATAFDELKLRVVTCQRERLTELRRAGEISDEAFHRLVEDLDWAELDATPHGGFAPLTTSAV
ncbi:cation:proton antiporter [Phenylobacterium deserti]|uniref:Sodium:proton antiporter n=1 Tax=Phenylobacterium deserti TaxID=1914756 RepID=A0A328AR33_9CAUL|nr:cation:proton antiporter [Phenylobacterium deserti]RAK56701.1 sodium:proton antiporter [Phenylobacterium deserti]